MKQKPTKKSPQKNLPISIQLGVTKAKKKGRRTKQKKKAMTIPTYKTMQAV